MEWNFIKRTEMSFSWLEVSAAFMGKDVFAYVLGGNIPHIGCTVLAVPRNSLTGDGSPGVTSSVLNLPGHKDEVLCRKLAESICRKLGTAVVCCGGFHMDGILPEQIEETVRLLESVAEEAAESLQKYAADENQRINQGNGRGEAGRGIEKNAAM